MNQNSVDEEKNTGIPSSGLRAYRAPALYRPCVECGRDTRYSIKGKPIAMCPECAPKHGQAIEVYPAS